MNVLSSKNIPDHMMEEITSLSDEMLSAIEEVAKKRRIRPDIGLSALILVMADFLTVLGSEDPKKIMAIAKRTCEAIMRNIEIRINDGEEED